MNEISAAHRAIRNQINPATPRRALVVEGPDDVQFIERQLDHRSLTWRQHWVVGPAGGKKRLLDILPLDPTWIGLVDADEWAPQTLVTLKVQHPNLHVLPRYCMESYFVLPAELWAMFPDHQQARITGGHNQIQAALLAPLDQWVRHGALWRVVNPLWAGLKAKGFKDALLDLAAAQNDDLIKQTLNEWHSYLDPATRFHDFQSELKKATALPIDQKVTLVVHGKSFFAAHVSTVLNSLLSQKSADAWLKDLIKVCPPIPDLSPLWTTMGL